jgi:hypothetical protein
MDRREDETVGLDSGAFIGQVGDKAGMRVHDMAYAPGRVFKPGWSSRGALLAVGIQPFDRLTALSVVEGLDWFVAARRRFSH